MADNRTLVVKGSRTFTPETKNDKSLLVLTVRHVINPNMYEYFDDFKVYTKCGLTVLDYGLAYNNLRIQNYPDAIYYTELNSDSDLIYDITDYKFKAESNDSFEVDKDDLILITFPSEFNQNYS